MLLAVGAVHHRLVACGLRTLATLVVETDEAREAHHVACLLGYGAEAICPRLALETVAALAAADKVGGDRPSPAEAQVRLRTAIEDAVLKIMSKLGHLRRRGATAAPRRSTFSGSPRRSSSSASAERPRRSRGSASPSSSRRRSSGCGTRRLESPGYVKFRKGGEPHETDADVVDAAHALRQALNGEGP